MCKKSHLELDRSPEELVLEAPLGKASTMATKQAADQLTEKSVGNNYRTLCFVLQKLGFGANQAVDAQELAAIFGFILVIFGPNQASGGQLLRLVTTLWRFASR